MPADLNVEEWDETQLLAVVNQKRIDELVESMSASAKEDLVFVAAAVYDCIKNDAQMLLPNSDLLRRFTSRPDEQTRIEIASRYLQLFYEPLLAQEYNCQAYYNLLQTQSLDLLDVDDEKEVSST